MNLVPIMVSFLAGLLLGAIFFGGLWFTVKRLSKTANPGLWMLASFAIRVSVLLLGIYAFTNGQWEGILACLVGFLIARTVWIHRLRGAVIQIDTSRQEMAGSLGASSSHAGGNKNGYR